MIIDDGLWNKTRQKIIGKQPVKAVFSLSEMLPTILLCCIIKKLGENRKALSNSQNMPGSEISTELKMSSKLGKKITKKEIIN